MRNAARLFTLTVCFALAGCPERNPPVDGGTDAGRDAPSIDVRADVPSPGDAGPVDGGEDAGTDDGGTTDTGVPFCGDGVTNGDEDCDLSDLGLETCATVGFDTGTLDCADDCTFDTSGCRDFSCGDGMIEGTEVCDGTDLGKNTCGSAGFDGGTLACMDCALDTSGCTTCGDGTIEGTEVCDGANLGGATCASLGFVSGALACGTTCAAYDTSGCAAAPAPTAGQIVITEIMPNPRTISDNDGEWFEVTNTSAGPLQLQDCVVSDNIGTMFMITSSVVVPAGGYASFARSAMAGFVPAYVYSSSWALANNTSAGSMDQVAITCGGVLIDEVTYGVPATWHFGDGIAMSLSASATTAAANDMPSNWCLATAQYEATGPNLGTPGAANPACPVVTAEVCTGGVDEDGDTFIDCLDSDCATDPACATPTEICTGGVDEDGDTFIDCLDSDCVGDPACPAPSTPALLFSEYIEGSVGSHKAVEIRNAGTTSVDLAAASCSVRVYANGATTGSTIALTGTIAPGGVYTVCVNTMTIPAASCNQTSGSLSFNGNDAVAIQCGTSLVDVIGRIGENPGASWGTAPGPVTVDSTLRRRCGITAGDPIGGDAFDPATQWVSFPDGTLDGLGMPACAP